MSREDKYIMAMAVSKVRQAAPALADTYEKTGRLLTSKGVRPNVDQADVRIYVDHSGSTEKVGNQRLYSRVEESLGDKTVMQHAIEFGVAGGLFFDDNGRIPFSLFDTQVTPLGDATVDNYTQVLAKHSEYDFGGTSYITVFRHVLAQLGFDGIRLGSARRGLSVKATAKYPTYVQVITDGEPLHDDPRQVLEWLKLMSQLPIFWEFTGVGEHDFMLLRQLDDLEDRLIDNAGFFDMKDKKARTAEGVVELMLGEFASSYYPEARRLGLITG
jgi:hypothetical protein